jgi:hypothetical protein
MSDQKRERLRLLADSQGISLNKLVDEWATTAIAQFDAESRFRARAARGRAKRGLALLDKVEKSANGRAARGR